MAFGGADVLASMGRSSRTALLDRAEEVEFGRGETLLRSGRVSDAVLLLTEGVAEVRAARGGAPLGRVGVGEFVGEISFVLGTAASAEVVAAERTMALRFTHEQLHELLADPAIGSDFWRAIAAMTARRLVERSGMLSLSSSSSADVPAAVYDTMAEFSRVLEQLDASDDVGPEVVDQRFTAFKDAVQDAHEAGVLTPAAMAEIRRATMPTASLSNLLKRIWEKPRGYAGDWETIEYLYQAVPAGVGRVGVALDAAAIDSPGPRAARNRRALLAGQIRRAAEHGPAVVTSLAAGPAREIFDVIASEPESIRSVDLLDLDQTALDHVDRELERVGFRDRARLHRSNLIKLALGREQLHLEEQDLVYSVGLIDYFPDELVVSLLDLVHPWLRTGGRVILGNFHPRNPDRGFMEVLEWTLIHRTEEDMERIFAQSAFGRPCDEILWEEQRINLFAVAEKR